MRSSWAQAVRSKATAGILLCLGLPPMAVEQVRTIQQRVLPNLAKMVGVAVAQQGVAMLQKM